MYLTPYLDPKMDQVIATIRPTRSDRSNNSFSSPNEVAINRRFSDFKAIKKRMFQEQSIDPNVCHFVTSSESLFMRHDFCI